MPRIAAQQKSNQNGQQQKSNVETTTSVRWKTNIVEDSSTGKTTASKQKKTGILKKGRGKNSSQTLRKTKPKAVKVKVTRTTKDCVDRDKKKINKSKQSGDAEDNEHRNLRPKSTPQFTAINMVSAIAIEFFTILDTIENLFLMCSVLVSRVFWQWIQEFCKLFRVTQQDQSSLKKVRHFFRCAPGEAFYPPTYQHLMQS